MKNDEVKNWTARFLTVDGHLMDTKSFENCTNSEAFSKCQDHMELLGPRCDEFNLNPDPDNEKN